MQTSEAQLKEFRQEHKHLQELKHSNIVRLLAACDGEQALITEHCERGSLADLLAKPETARLLTDERKWQLLQQIASALEFLHSRKPPVVHRDIKSNNILVSQAWLAKLADFGLARLQMHTAGLSAKGSGVGTLAFQAPEQFEESGDADEDEANAADSAEGKQQQQQAVRVGVQADIYGFAGVALHVLTGQSPFYKLQPLRIMADKLNKRIPPPELRKLALSTHPHAAAQAQFLATCFAFTPGDRPTAAQLVEFCSAQLALAEQAALNEATIAQKLDRILAQGETQLAATQHVAANVAALPITLATAAAGV